jgi:hypothetical protein
MGIVYVDGFKIRNTLDDDFGIIDRNWGRIGIFAPKFYVPENQIWIDHKFKNETDFLLKTDIPPEQYTTREDMKKFCLPGPVPDFVRKQEILNNVTVKYVDGSIVRQYMDPEFILGGHDLVYSYIPKNEIWLDALMDARETPYILLHEQVERDLMAGDGKNYDIAHERATAADKERRIADGCGMYPGSANYQWRDWSNEEIIKQYVIA